MSLVTSLFTLINYNINLILFACSLASMEATQAARLAGKEHYNALKNKKEEIEKTIDEKEAEMRRIMIEEAVSYILALLEGIIYISDTFFRPGMVIF